MLARCEHGPGTRYLQTLDLGEGQGEETKHIEQPTGCERPVGLLEDRFKLNHYACRVEVMSVDSRMAPGTEVSGESWKRRR